MAVIEKRLVSREMESISDQPPKQRSAEAAALWSKKKYAKNPRSFMSRKGYIAGRGNWVGWGQPPGLVWPGPGPTSTLHGPHVCAPYAPSGRPSSFLPKLANIFLLHFSLKADFLHNNKHQFGILPKTVLVGATIIHQGKIRGQFISKLIRKVDTFVTYHLSQVQLIACSQVIQSAQCRNKKTFMITLLHTYANFQYYAF